MWSCVLFAIARRCNLVDVILAVYHGVTEIYSRSQISARVCLRRLNCDLRVPKEETGNLYCLRAIASAAIAIFLLDLLVTLKKTAPGSFVIRK